MNTKPQIAIIGGGTAGLFLAAHLNTDLYDVTIYEKKNSLGRKFLVAGSGGFNLTHSENISTLKTRYSPPTFLSTSLDAFDNDDLRSWLSNLGIPTYVGSSGRVFPKKGIKPIQVLKRIENYLIDKEIKFEFNHTFTGWLENNSIEFNSKKVIAPDLIVFALGGASWKVTGSDGSWLSIFQGKGIQTVPFRSSNCAFQIHWDKNFLDTNEGKPLKNITISTQSQTQKGEAVVTKFGIEGNAIYGLSLEIQNELKKAGKVIIYIDFKPNNNLEDIYRKIIDSNLNTSQTLKEKLKLAKQVIHLLKSNISKEEFLDKKALATNIKQFPLTILGSAPLDEAISTIGGIDIQAVSSNFELNKFPNIHCIGEMLDWNAPTGGYLIQACASMGVYLANQLNEKSKDK